MGLTPMYGSVVFFAISFTFLSFCKTKVSPSSCHYNHGRTRRSFGIASVYFRAPEYPPTFFWLQYGQQHQVVVNYMNGYGYLQAQVHISPLEPRHSATGLSQDLKRLRKSASDGDITLSRDLQSCSLKPQTKSIIPCIV